LERTNLVCALVPSDEELTLQMKDNCGDIYDTVTIGPYIEGDVSDNVIVEAIPTTSLMNVFGTVEDCGENLIEYGFVSIETAFGTFHDLQVEDGMYSISFIACNQSETEVTMTAVDLDNLVQSIPQTFDLDFSSSPFENNLAACGETIDAEMVFNSTTLATNLTSTECLARVTKDEILISASDDATGPDGEYRLLVGVQGFSVGTHPANLVVFLEASNGYLQLDAPNEGFEVEILEYGNVGQTINGRFNYQGTEIGTFIADRIQ